MTLEKHIVDTMKEWQIKIGSFDSGIRLYYPKTSLCRYLNPDTDIEVNIDTNVKINIDTNIDIDNATLCKLTERYFAENIKYLGKVTVSANRERFCIMVGKEGCDYVEKKVPEPEFLAKFLKILKGQKIEKIIKFFEEYAKNHGTSICMEAGEEELETILYFENEEVEPYVYCIDQNEFGITYHRFTREDYMELWRETI